MVTLHTELLCTGLSWLPSALVLEAPLSFQTPSPSSSIVDEFKLLFNSNLWSFFNLPLTKKVTFISNTFFLFSGYIGYIQGVTLVPHSKSSSNLYIDVTVQVSTKQVKEITVMHLKGQTSNWQLFVDRMTAQQPVKLSDKTMTQSDTIFFNKGASIEDVPTHYRFQVCTKRTIPSDKDTKITSLHKLTSGVFNISGVLKWNREPHIPSDKTSQMVRDSTFIDSTESMPLSVKTHLRH